MYKQWPVLNHFNPVMLFCFRAEVSVVINNLIALLICGKMVTDCNYEKGQ